MGPQQPMRIAIPPEVVQKIAGNVLNTAANAIVVGDYEGAEAIPDNHKLIIAEMLLTLAQNRELETTPCESCGEIRLEHALDLVSGFRWCKEEKQPKPSAEDPTLIPPRTRFVPKVSRIVAPNPQETSRIIMPGGRG